MSHFHLLNKISTLFLFLAISITINSPTTFSQESNNIVLDEFPIKEATVEQLQAALRENKVTSKELVEYYINKINKLNPTLKAVIEVNPDALELAQKADDERKAKASNGVDGLSMLHGIPVLVKDSIATKDKMNTTAGSYALLGSVVPKDAGVVTRLRQAGAIILGKASMTEWGAFRSSKLPNGWSARSGQGKNPYNLGATTCGSSSGSAIAVAVDIIIIAIGTETDGSILCPASYISIVGIKPTLGLTSHVGVIPISPHQDTVGPMGRTVKDAVHLLDAIVGIDDDDSEATQLAAAQYIPPGGYAQFLNVDGLQGKRLGIVRNPFWNSMVKGSVMDVTFKRHLVTLREKGAVIVDNLQIPNIKEILSGNAERTMQLADFKLAINSYLEQLEESPVRDLAGLIQMNRKLAAKEMNNVYGQDYFLKAQATNGYGAKEINALVLMAKWSLGYEKVMQDNNLDAIITPGSSFSTVLALGGYPGISVPAGYHKNGVPFGICFGGLTGTEPRLIEIAYAFEQATKVRKTPPIDRLLASY